MGFGEGTPCCAGPKQAGQPGSQRRKKPAENRVRDLVPGWARVRTELKPSSNSERRAADNNKMHSTEMPLPS